LPIIAPQSPGDCFHAALQAAEIAVRYRTPVMILSDGSLANGSEPWKVPDAATLESVDPGFATEPNAPDGSGEFWPYLRDADTLARPWAIPGTPGLEHRIGGLEKADGRGSISYDPDNHDRMVRLRQAKIDAIPVPDLTVDDPTGDAEVLVLGWGSTFGPIGAGARRVRNKGQSIATAHLRHLNPLPANLGEVLGRYRTVLVPEMNLGQLALLLRARYLIDAKSYTKVSGLPFKAEELQDVFLGYVSGDYLTGSHPTTSTDVSSGALA
jgi:2-oxoglutarate ferredoxin oxidoreductase subunit alpha